MSLPAYYVCVLVGSSFLMNDPMPIYASGKIHGKVSVESQGDGGFGYDKIFYIDNPEISMASISSELKNTISHRAIAARSFLIELERDLILSKPPLIIVYIHLPWCEKQCPYCDFNIATNKKDGDEESLISAILRDLEASKKYISDRKFVSVYFGGGTPIFGQSKEY